MKPLGVITSSDPAVDTEISLTTEYDYNIDLIRIPFVTDANVADRTVTLKITANSEIIYQVPISAVIAASTTAEILFGNGLPYTSVGDTRMVPIPSDFRLPRGSVIETVTTNLQTGDNFGAAVLFLE